MTTQSNDCRLARRLQPRPGEHTIHFYYSSEEKARFVSLLAERKQGSALVVAASRSDFSIISTCMRQSGVNAMNLSLVEIPADWRHGIAAILDAALHERQRGADSILLLADFDGLVHQSALTELESLLATMMRGCNVASISQYDGRAFSQGIDVEKLVEYGTVLVGDYFRCRNASVSRVGSRPSRDTSDSLDSV